MPKSNRVAIDVERRMLTINFKDGSKVELPWDLLRDACPCAECKELHGPRDPLKLVAAPNKDLVEFKYSGNYAVQLVWGDGHSFGIYAWPYLRNLAEKISNQGR